MFKEIRAGPDGYARIVEDIFHHLRISACRYPLVQGIVIIVVECKSHRKPFYDERRKLSAVSAPLLLRVALYKLFVYIAADKADRLFFQVLRLAFYLGSLLRYLLHGLFRRDHAPHLIEGIHVKGQGVELSPVVRHGRIGKSVERRELLQIVPHLFVIGMEYMRAVFVYVYAFGLLRIYISGNMRAPVYYKRSLSSFRRFSREYRSVKPRSDYQKIIHIRYLRSSFLTSAPVSVNSSILSQ